MSMPSVPVVGIAWYRPESYGQVMELMADGASFPKSHASWRQKAGRMERELKRQGNQPVRVEVNPTVFAGWCKDREFPADSEARARFVAEAVAARHYSVAG